MYVFFRFDKPPLIIVSLDGFRADYMKRKLTPVLDKIGRCGVWTDRMRSVFPTKTFPNHFSIVTVSFLWSLPRSIFGTKCKMIKIIKIDVNILIH